MDVSTGLRPICLNILAPTLESTAFVTMFVAAADWSGR